MNQKQILNAYSDFWTDMEKGMTLDQIKKQKKDQEMRVRNRTNKRFESIDADKGQSVNKTRLGKTFGNSIQIRGRSTQ